MREEAVILNTEDPPFADALTDMLAARGISQQALADAAGVTRQSVNDWCQGRATPAAEMVFAIEEALNIQPGALSRTLGYLPLAVEDQPPASVAEAIRRAPELSDQARRLLLVLYDELTS